MVQLDAWNWPAFGSTLGLVFVMELLDNTQLVQVYYSSKYGRQWVLALASWSAFALTGLIGASFSGIRQLSEYATQSIELFFAMLLFAMGVITFSHSEKVLGVWRAMGSWIERNITKPFLYRMGEGEGQSEDSQGMLSMDERQARDVEEGGGAQEQRDDEPQHKAVEHKQIDDGAPQPAKRDVPVWKLFVLVFATVFVLELPDKTMLMIATLAQTSDFPVSVFAGYGCAMIAQSTIALAVGKGISRGAERFGEWLELVVGAILTVTGAVKVALMLFVGEFTIDWVKKAEASGSLSSSL
eukprot:m51a1_g5867 hypothetical protein (298) ;mRNA; f:396014-397456